jgi:hypothetical protein
MTTAGDLIIGGVAGAASRLGIGSNGQVLTLAAGIPAWATPSGGGTPTFRGCRAYKSANQSVNSATNAVVTFNAETFDSDAYHDNSTNPGRITVPSGLGGKYLLEAEVDWEGSATGIRAIWLRINGATIFTGAEFGTDVTFGAATVCSGIIALSAGDYVECLARQQSGGAINITPSAWGETHFAATLLGT